MLGVIRQKMADRQLLLADVAHRKTLTSGKPRLGYIGALGDGNLGDEAMFTAAQLLYPEHQLVTLLSSWREAELASKGLSGPDFFQGVILGGGTLISPYWHPAIAHAQQQGCGSWTLGSGIGSSGFGDEAAVALDGWAESLKQMSGVGLRGPRSLDTARNLGIGNAEQIGDLAAALTLDAPQQPHQRRKIVVNIAASAADNRLPQDIPALEAVTNYLRLADQFGDEVVGVAMHRTDGGPTRRVLDAAGLEHVSVQLPSDFAAFAKWVAGAHFTLSVRLHAAILAANLGIPSISLGYRDKNLDFMQSIGQERWHLPLETASLDQVTLAIKAMEAEALGLREDVHARMLAYRGQVGAYAARMVAS